MKLKLYREEFELIDFQIKGFISYCKNRNLSQVTIDGYFLKLKNFEDYLRQIGIAKINQVDTMTIREYLLFIADKKITNPMTGKVQKEGLSSYSLRNYFKAIRVFFNYLIEFEFLNENPISKLKSPKIEKKIIQTFSAEQIKSLIKVPNQRTLLGYRDYAIMLTLLDTGMRVSELINLKIEDINWNENLLLVMGKGRKERFVPFSSRLKRVLFKYLQLRRHLENDYLFVNRFGDALNRNRVLKMISKYGKLAKITKVRVSPHTFRHTFAKMWILNGGDVFSLQKILGHTTMDMVRNYVNLASSDVQIQHRKFSPLDRIGI
jgi:integrase/recombinase XerD